MKLNTEKKRTLSNKKALTIYPYNYLKKLVFVEKLKAKIPLHEDVPHKHSKIFVGFFNSTAEGMVQLKGLVFPEIHHKSKNVPFPY